jgi:hypothetical protein
MWKKEGMQEKYFGYETSEYGPSSRYSEMRRRNRDELYGAIMGNILAHINMKKNE